MMMLALFVVVVLKDRFCSNLFSTTGYESYRFEGPIYIMCLVVPKISRVLSNSLERGKKDRQLLIQHTFRRSLITVLFFWHDAHLAPFSRFTKGLCLNCLVKTVGGSMHLSERKSLLVGRRNFITRISWLQHLFLKPHGGASCKVGLNFYSHLVSQEMDIFTQAFLHSHSDVNNCWLDLCSFFYYS